MDRHAVDSDPDDDADLFEDAAAEDWETQTHLDTMAPTPRHRASLSRFELDQVEDFGVRDRIITRGAQPFRPR